MVIPVRREAYLVYDIGKADELDGRIIMLTAIESIEHP